MSRSRDAQRSMLCALCSVLYALCSCGSRGPPEAGRVGEVVKIQGAELQSDNVAITGWTLDEAFSPAQWWKPASNFTSGGGAEVALKYGMATATVYPEVGEMDVVNGGKGIG
ncbi:hypothetical protein ACMFMG_001264 [Clarireedia jacksonii]